MEKPNLMTCPNCGAEAIMDMRWDDYSGTWYRCAKCGKGCDQKELNDSQPAESCVESVERLYREQAAARIEVIHTSCGICGDITEYTRDWVCSTFSHAERILIDRIEVHV